jgi:ABC-type antimicrobial peptide transport system permease subunit
MIGEGLRPTFTGMIAGLAGAMALSWVLHTTLTFPGSSDFFYGVPFYDPVTFVGLTGFFAVVAAIASFVPVKRAITVDPLVALRYN